VWWER
jgi:hypothetical protein